MPCAQFEALEARRQAWRDWGEDSDKSTIRDEDEGKNGNNDLQEDAVPLEARIHQTTVVMFKRVLLFSQGTAEALCNDQKIKTLTNQKTLEDSLLDTKPPETPALTHEPHSAAKAFNDMLILLGKMWGIARHPLSYVPPSQFERTQ
jgi:hypothetical protein